ncbi:MAG TPA: hypothetical protein VK524_14150, partial [Polyangiaceae bacterium]|nr:hypothetical protein [Polyangiaceae bacterium]
GGSAGTGATGGVAGTAGRGGAGGSAGIGGSAGTGGSCARTCTGCCDAQGRCQGGTQNTACGRAGASCSNCSSNGETCMQPGGYCAFFPTCSRATCPNGCCDAQGVCRDGRTNAVCGTNGQACSNCGTNGRACAAQGFCYAGRHCGPDNCAGCCTANGECRNGTSSLSCGQYGALCENCLSNFELCRDRVCSDGDRCPAAYAGCSPAASTTTPVRSTACNPADLATLAQACRGENPGPNCVNTFRRLFATNPGCYDCMQQFAFSDAYARCVSPFLSPECNHHLTCAVDCLADTCGQCPGGRQASCQSSALGQNGQCGGHVLGYYCAEAALQGPGAFCDFDRYNDLGLWWQAVGGAYCSR